MSVRKLLAIAPLLAATVVTGCIPWSRERPAYADLCQTQFQFKVPGPNAERTIVLRTYLYDYDAQWSDEPFEQLYSVKYPGEKYPKPEFYVQLIAYEKSSHGLFNTETLNTPIIYDSRQAYVTFEDGSRLGARPELHLGSLTYDYPLEDARYSRESPYNINSDEVRRRIPKITNDSHHGSVYVIFKTDAFNADSKWKINLGALEIESHKVQIPQLELCYHPVKKWIGIEPLMRP